MPEDSDLEKFFTDAEQARQLFDDLVRSAPLPKRLLVIHGVGGVGKSTLLKMYRLSCYRRHIPVALVGAEDAPSSVDMLAGWAKDLGSTGVKLRAFPSTLDHYRALQTKVEAKAEQAKEAMRGAAGELGKVAAKTAVEMAVSTIPIVGPLAAALGGAGTEAAIDWLRGFLSKPDMEFYLDPSKQLTDDFLSDLARAAARQRIVLMADTYEQMTALDGWMRDLARQLSKNVLLVISGRAVPEWDRAWQSWMGQAKIVELQEMTPDDQRTLVHRYYAYIRGGEPDPEQVEAIVEFARGLPIAAATVVQLWVKHGVEDFHTVKVQVVADLADRLLEGVSPEMRPAFEAAAVLRYFNADSLRALLDEGVADALYAELRRWPFIHPRREGLAVHDTMREMMNEALCVRTPDRFRILQERAAAYYEQRLKQATSDERDHLILELLYHRFLADDDEGTRVFCQICEELAGPHFINRLRTVLRDVGTYRLQQRGTSLWRDYYNGRLMHLEFRFEEAIKEYQAIGNDEDAEPRLRAYALCDLGDICRRTMYLRQAGGIERAVSALEQSQSLAPELDSKLVSNSFSLGGVYQRLSEWDKVDSCYRKAMAFYRERGDTYGLAYAWLWVLEAEAHQGHWKEMFDAETRSSEFLSTLTGHPFLRSELMLTMAVARVWAGRYAETEQVLQEGLAIRRKLGDPFALSTDLGMVLGMQRKYERASRCFEERIDMSRRIGDPNGEAITLGYWGATLIKKGDWQRAEEYLQRSLSIRESLQDHWGILYTLGWMGILHELRREWQAASDCYNRSLDHKWTGRHHYQSGALVGICRVKFRQGIFTDIRLVATEAEQLAHQYEYNDHLASLCLTQAHVAWNGCIDDWGVGFDAALHYYQQALIYALRYNRFLLDEVLWGGGVATPLRPIIPRCLARGKEGRRMLVALRDWWQTGANDVGAPRHDTISPIPEGITLLEAERLARGREPGDGSPQVSVVEKIEQALEEAEQMAHNQCDDLNQRG